MKSTEKKYIIDRDKTDEHDKLSIPDLLPSRASVFYNHVQNVFSHQIACYTNEELNERDLPKYFYSDCYHKPKIKYKSGNETISIEDFINGICSNYNHDGYNQVAYLLGNVGVGKTAFINYLITERFSKYVLEKKLFFIRLDIHQNFFGNTQPLRKFYEMLFSKVYRILSKHGEILDPNDQDINDAWVKYKSTYEEYRLSRRNEITFIENKFLVLLKILKKSKRILLIIDNLDFLCHLNDKGLFDDLNDINDRHFLLELYEFIAAFSHEGSFGELDLSILFVTREDSFEILRKSDTTDRWPTSNIDKFYTLESPKWETIFASRKKLLSYVVENKIKTEKEKNKYNKIILTIEKHMKSKDSHTNSVANHILNITNYGMRELMSFFSQYAWIGDEHTSGRLIKSYPVGLITFILGKGQQQWRRYSQKYSKFPNIYLNCMQPNGEGDFNNVHEHKHSYWLKWLIIALLEVAEKKKLPFKGSDFIDIFHANGKGYEEKLVKHCLNELADVNVCNMIKVVRNRVDVNDDKKVKISKVSLSKRGLYCKKYIFDRFYYLQLIIDDYMLPIPRSIRNYYMYKDGKDYGYIVDTISTEYWKKSKYMINRKSMLVLLFLEVLEISLDLEMKIYDKVFERLYDEGVEMPKLSSLKEKIIEELKSISKAHENFLDFEKISNLVNIRRNEIENSLLNLYTLP